MRRALAGVALTLAVGLSACALGEDDDFCDVSAQVGDETLVGVFIPEAAPQDLPRAGGRQRVRFIDCNGSEPKTFRRVKGLPPQAALLDGEFLYVGSGFLIATEGHPLHNLFAESITYDPQPVRGCRKRTFRGRVASMPVFETEFLLDVGTSRPRSVTIHPRMTADLPEVGGLPRLVKGTRVTVAGHHCHSGRFYAMQLDQR